MNTDVEFYKKEFVPGANEVNVYDEQAPYWQTGERTVVTQIVGQGANDMGQALDYMDYNMKEGESVKVEMVLSSKPSQWDLDNMYEMMVGSGAHVTKPKLSIQGGLPVVTFQMKKGSPLLGLIVPFIPIIITGVLITFGIFRIEAISKALMPILLTIVGGAVVVAALVTRPHVVETAPKLLSAAALRR